MMFARSFCDTASSKRGCAHVYTALAPNSYSSGKSLQAADGIRGPRMPARGRHHVSRNRSGSLPLALPACSCTDPWTEEMCGPRVHNLKVPCLVLFCSISTIYRALQYRRRIIQRVRFEKHSGSVRMIEKLLQVHASQTWSNVTVLSLVPATKNAGTLIVLMSSRNSKSEIVRSIVEVMADGAHELWQLKRLKYQARGG